MGYLRALVLKHAHLQSHGHYWRLLAVLMFGQKRQAGATQTSGHSKFVRQRIVLEQPKFRVSTILCITHFHAASTLPFFDGLPLSKLYQQSLCAERKRKAICTVHSSGSCHCVLH
jgi:hypothetical protein